MLGRSLGVALWWHVLRHRRAPPRVSGAVLHLVQSLVVAREEDAAGGRAREILHHDIVRDARVIKRVKGHVLVRERDARRTRRTRGFFLVGAEIAIDHRQRLRRFVQDVILLVPRVFERRA
jgi:hypothetical protein